MDCRLQDDGPGGWKAVFLVNTCWFFSCSFRSWALAIGAADDKHADLVESGWTPVGARPERPAMGPFSTFGHLRGPRGPA